MGSVSRMQTVLLIGATSGIGEAFARQLHALGKKVIITGRRADRLDALKKELKGLETVKVSANCQRDPADIQQTVVNAKQWDASDLSSLSSTAEAVLKSYPNIDTVFLNFGQQKSFYFADPSSSTNESIIEEVNTNLTAPMVLTRLFMPHLVSRASAGNQAQILMTTSGLAYVPAGLYPVYCPTKAALHSFCVGLRQQINNLPEETKKNLSVVEVSPPYVDTALDAGHREAVAKVLGGGMPPMPLNEFIEKAMAGLEDVGEDGKPKKEVAMGFSQMGIDAWRGSIGKILEQMGFGG